MSENYEVKSTLSGKRSAVRSDKSSSKRSRRSFRFIHIGHVSRNTVAADVRKEAEKFGEVDEVLDHDIYTSRSGIVSKKFMIRFTEPKDAQRCLSGFCRNNIFGRKEIEVHVWKKDYNRIRDNIIAKRNDELELPSLNDRDWSSDGVNKINSKNKLTSDFELVKMRDNIKDFGRLFKKHQARESASEFFEEYELMAVRTKAKMVIYETKKEPDIVRLKLYWFTVFLKIAGLTSKASDTDEGTAKALAELRLFNVMKSEDSLCCKIFDISENDYAQALRLPFTIKSQRADIRISKNADSDVRTITTIKPCRSKHGFENVFGKVSERDENDNIPNTPPQDLLILSDSEGTPSTHLSDVTRPKKFNAVTVPEPVVTFAVQTSGDRSGPAVGSSSMTPMVSLTVNSEPLVTDHTESSMKSVVKRQIIVIMNKYAEEINQLRQHLKSSKNVQIDVAKVDRKQIKLKAEITKKIRQINVLNSELANKDKEIKDLLEEKCKLENEKNEVKRQQVEIERDFFEKERTLRKKLSRDYENKLRRHGIVESPKNIIRIGDDDILKTEALHRAVKGEANYDDESS